MSLSPARPSLLLFSIPLFNRASACSSVCRFSMGKEFSTTPRDVPRVETRYRRIVTPLPHPESLATLETLRQFEPQSMRGQPPIVWERAEDIYVFDKYGNQWLDWSSGVLVTNCGHGAPEVRQAIIDQVR